MQKQVLITGALGFIGSACVNEFLKNSIDIVLLDNLSSSHIEVLEELKKLDKSNNIKGFEQIDLQNQTALDNVFEKYDFEAVIHFAGSAIVKESFENPEKYYKNNVFATSNLLNSMQKANVSKIIFSSSCATYGASNCDFIDEKTLQNPISPYGKSKLDAEKDILSRKNINYIIFRYFNAIGAFPDGYLGEWHDNETRLVPNILRANNSAPFKFCGTDYDTKDGTPIRDYVDVTDLARAHFMGYKHLEKNMGSDIFNLGSAKGYSVKEIFDTCSRIKNAAIPFEIEAKRIGDVPCAVANNSYVNSILKWQPEIPLDKSILNVLKWEQKLEKMRKNA